MVMFYCFRFFLRGGEQLFRKMTNSLRGKIKAVIFCILLCLQDRLSRRQERRKVKKVGC